MSNKVAPESVTLNLAADEFIHGFYTGVRIEPEEGVIEMMDVSVAGDNNIVVRELPETVVFIRIGISNSEIVLGNVMILESASDSVAATLTEMIRDSALSGTKLNIKCNRIFMNQRKEELFRTNQDHHIYGSWLQFAIYKIAIPKEYARTALDNVVLRDNGSVLAFEQATKGNIVH